MIRFVTLLLSVCVCLCVGQEIGSKCPEPTEIEPCQCKNDDLLLLECNFATQEDLDRIFATEFPVTSFDKLFIYGGNVSKLMEIKNGLTFAAVYINANDLVEIGTDFLSGSAECLEELKIPSSALTTDGFPFESLPLYSKLLQLGIDGSRTFMGPLPPIVSDSLVTVNFAFDEITEVNSDTFRGAPLLASIELTGNSLTELGRHSFTVRPGVANDISLGFNSISSVHPEAFLLPAADQTNGTSVVVTLYNNLLESVDEEVFKPLVDLDTPNLSWRASVNLDSNPVACDCSEYWLVMQSPDGEQPYGHRISGTCADGTAFRDLYPWDFPGC